MATQAPIQGLPPWPMQPMHGMVWPQYGANPLLVAQLAAMANPQAQVQAQAAQAQAQAQAQVQVVQAQQLVSANKRVKTGAGEPPVHVLTAEAEKRAKRMERARSASRKTRQKHKAYMQELETKVKSLKEEHSALENRLRRSRESLESIRESGEGQADVVQVHEARKKCVMERIKTLAKSADASKGGNQELLDRWASTCHPYGEDRQEVMKACFHNLFQACKPEPLARFVMWASQNPAASASTVSVICQELKLSPDCERQLVQRLRGGQRAVEAFHNQLKWINTAKVNYNEYATEMLNWLSTVRGLMTEAQRLRFIEFMYDNMAMSSMVHTIWTPEADQRDVERLEDPVVID